MRWGVERLVRRLLLVRMLRREGYDVGGFVG